MSTWGTHWWRIVPLAAGLLVSVVASGISLFGMVPIVLWCVLARTWRSGFVVGMSLVAVHAWFVVPRQLGWSGPWVPSYIERFWLYAVVTAFVCAVGLAVQRWLLAGLGWLFAMIGSGFFITVVLLFDALEAKPRDEGVLPGPSGLQVVEGAGYCGSGNCSRDAVMTGDRAPEVVREHLESRGYMARSPERMCWAVGVVYTHEVCADMRTISADKVEVTWYIN
ncbi:hypothetical protein [Lentzea flaviverrucosa]|uniref:Uncharacterized protein n=1 Tax=Lentzea flaviverrucosa TaxID=200379 RepID=A0A1H9AY55_9PSEU|nr:hypothetical protein [Lentzea flaviverrucosa]RDI31938.1 hypothetical protein DFR72_103339 [Lentzea flaviverrucosa]SEP81455.1 hypothetical protein SAMN05216195_101319 [Lentzea flaviverrucosa]